MTQLETDARALATLIIGNPEFVDDDRLAFIARAFHRKCAEYDCLTIAARDAVNSWAAYLEDDSQLTPTPEIHEHLRSLELVLRQHGHHRELAPPTLPGNRTADALASFRPIAER